MKYIIALLAIFLTSNFGLCQEAELKSTKAKAAVRDYERKIEDVDEDFEKQLKDLEKSYQMKSEILRARLLSNLNAAMEEEARKINLEEANKIESTIKEFKEWDAPQLVKLMGPTKNASSTKPKLQIPKDAVKFKRHHYYFITSPMFWHVAKDYAESRGGHLVRIETKSEWEFINRWLNGKEHFYIDGTDQVKEGSWHWTNGKEIDFTNFKHFLDGQPSENFLGFFRDHIADLGWGRHPFIIEWDK
jgi:hypothetical protein